MPGRSRIITDYRTKLIIDNPNNIRFNESVFDARINSLISKYFKELVDIHQTMGVPFSETYNPGMPEEATQDKFREQHMSDFSRKIPEPVKGPVESSVCSGSIGGMLSSYALYPDANMITVSRVFTRKQTRKFKNRRWNKKYLKKHSYLTGKPMPDVIIDSVNNRIFGHPTRINAIKREAGLKYNYDNLEGAL